MAYALAHWIATSPWLAMSCGLIVAGLGGLDLLETGRGALDIAFSSQSGLMLVGLQQAAFGLANLLLGTRLAGIGLLGAEHDDHHPAINRMLKGYAENSFLVFALSIALLAMVSIQAWKDWVLGGVGQARSVWYFGLALVALLSVARSAESILLALGMMADAESKGHFAVRLAHRINRHVRKPWLLVTVATTCIGFGLAEELFFVAHDASTRVFIAHYGFLLFALLEASKLIPIVFRGAALANEGLAPPDSTDLT